MPRFIILFLALLLVAAATAAPPLLAATQRIALLRVELGRVLLDGQSVSTPQLVEQGQTLTLEKGARARLQILGSGSELGLTGPQTLSIDRNSLLARAKTVKRGALSAVPDIGNTVYGAVNTTRDQRGVRGFRVGTSPTLDNESWRFPLEVNDAFLKAEYHRHAQWSISRVDLDEKRVLAEGRQVFDSEELASGDCDGLQTYLELPKSAIVPGQRYVVQVTVYEERPDQFDPISTYHEPFRLLTPEERKTLEDLEASTQKAVKRNKDVLPLLELSSLYLEWDQVSEASRVLDQARLHPGWSKLDPGAVRQADIFQATLDAIWDRPFGVSSQKD